MAQEIMRRLGKIKEAAERLEMSRSYLRKLPPGTPGVYRFGRAVRFDIEELRAGLQERSEKN